jgi:hypothetical protein
VPRARKPPPSPRAADIEVLRREIHAMKRRCTRCPSNKRPIGFDTTCVVGDRIEQDEDGEDC